MSLEQTTSLYASVLMRLLPEGGYDTAQSTTVYDDVYAHAKLLAQTDIDAHRLLQVLESIPVELLNEYEREYGLPMKCMVSSSLSIVERIEILRWVRISRNVMNRMYLEQLLAVFGVTLNDIVRFTPLQCTAAQCISPVDTDRSRFKVVLRLQYPVNADIGCIIENYLPGYLRVDWVVDMPWGEWILNAGYTLVGDDIRYTGFKTNIADYYDSHADFNLVTALVRSFHDLDMQEWQGFINAANELTGVTNWVVDSLNNRINYIEQAEYSRGNWCAANGFGCRSTSQQVADDWFNSIGYQNVVCSSLDSGIDSGSGSTARYFNFYECVGKNGPNDVSGRLKVISDNVQVTGEERSILFEVVAQKIISTAASHTNESVQMFAEIYIDAVANSIFNANVAKQFIRLSELISQFENNKTLRVT